MDKPASLISALILAFGALGWSLLASGASQPHAGSEEATKAADMEAVQEANEEKEKDAKEDLFALLMAKGEEVYEETCAQCHGDEGGGQIGPPLRENVADAGGVIRAIVAGRGNMPPIAWDFSDLKLAAVVTFVRNSWDNEYGMVTEEEAAEFRPSF